MYKCCKTVLQNSWKFCPHCGDDNPHWEGVKKKRYYMYEGAGASLFTHSRKVAVKTSEFRCPRKGEYYLSGAVPMAYKAPNDLSSAYRIMDVIEKPTNGSM